MKLLPADWTKALPHLLIGGGVGVTAAVVLTLAQKEPARIVEMFRGWGPGSLIGVIAVLLVSRGFDRMVDAQLKGAASAQQLADAVKLIAKKDDEQARENQLVTDYLTRTTSEVLDGVKAMRRELATQAAQLAAIEARHVQEGKEKAQRERAHAAARSG